MEFRVEKLNAWTLARGAEERGLPRAPAEVEVVFRNTIQVTEEFARGFFEGLESVQITAQPEIYTVYINSSIPARETVLILSYRVTNFLRQVKGERGFQSFRVDPQ